MLKWNIHDRAHKSPPHFAILCQMCPLNAVMSHFSKFHLRLGLPVSIFPSRLPIKSLCALLTRNMHYTCPVALVRGNAKAKDAPLRFVKTYWSRGIAPPILNLGAVWRWVMSYRPRPLYPREMNPPAHIEYEAGGAPHSAWKFWTDSLVLQPIAWSLCQLSYTGSSSVT